MINAFQPMLGDDELAAVAEVFRSNWIGKGPRVRAFEDAFAAHLGVGPDQVMTLNSCTEATFLAMELAGLGAGDDVVLPAVSFVGAANAVAAHGARPVFCDVDPRTLNPSASDVEAALTPATRAVLVLHYAGYPGDIAAIAELCRARGLLLIEDAACAVASRVAERACGTFGDLGVWSFDHGKIAVTVDGGMLYARDPELLRRGRKRAYFGLEQFSGFDHAKVTDTRWWEFEVGSFSRRSIMNDVTAAIGCVQLRRLPEFLRRRREIVERYDTELAGLPGLLLPPAPPPGHRTSHYMYWVQMEEHVRDEVARDLYRRGVYATFRYPPLHRVPIYGSDARLPGAEHAADRTLCLPLHQGLDDTDVDLIVETVRTSVPRRSASAAASAPASAVRGA
ncbi:DegT/DnrJ/EryC1/StrS aminotransferase family protein [Actinomadura sp. WMMB 499]|uniref:DegT/DnrJ/EryC1/StrS family aminotransferase n=1 Tax=Actinomadura sp. WMMB 499 TaxID=1219491 RepID=UPI00124440AE|nr:DegT/DnrJ/EryC1/StrS family aminotransferase [Actinomadura sp. WMMB 499]QFG22943.1 DegT/DnrJ/EryC1/StrS family aminotransferase [Actinomadura sp. WMMB 499]